MSQRSSGSTARKGGGEVLRVIAEALAPYLREYLHPAEQYEPEFYSQHDSPLGRRRHLDLVRRRVLKGKKVGRLVLVHRDELRAFIEGQASTPTATGEADVLEDWGLRSRGRP